MSTFKKIILGILFIALTSVTIILLNENESSTNYNNDLRMLSLNNKIPKQELNEKYLDYSSGILYKHYDEGFPIVNIKLLNSNIEPSTSNLSISWETTPINTASNSWIGVYPYAQRSTKWNLDSHFLVNNTFTGQRELKSPENAGIYEIRYIQDNNLFTIASTGPIVINPSDSFIELSKNALSPEETVSVTWEFTEKTKAKFSGSGENTPLETKICLNIVGAYDYEDCYWSQVIKEASGKTKIKMPDFAGYFVVRVIIQYKTWKFLPELECLAVSKLIKVSNRKFTITPTELSSAVASNLDAEWKLESPHDQDWIGIYSINSLEVFTRSANPIQSTKTKGELKGKVSFDIPPNKQAGGYLFIYFRNHRPIAVSDIITMNQPKVKCPSERKTMSKIKHLVIICTENHSFDSYMGNYCQAEAFTNPNCTTGANCCEKPPSDIQGFSPVTLNDSQNLAFDPNHDQDCERCEINGGRMDGYVKGCYCSDSQNFAVADKISVEIIHNFAEQFALADRYFQPTAGASSQNDMFFARASYVFKDNTKIPIGSIGSNCWYLKHGIPSEIEIFYDPTITSLLSKCGFNLKSYAEGYRNASQSFENNKCYPFGYDSGDIPFGYYAGISDNKRYMADFEDFKGEILNGTLPEVSFIKPLGINTGHPQDGSVTDEMKFIKSTVELVLNSSYEEDTLVVWVPDESGGFYDHVSPPMTNEVDGIPYGPRIPMIAFGRFAKKNYISHVEMEHSSIVKFIEWNWLNGQTGQLNTRDRNVNSIGDMIHPEKAGIFVPN